jgi:hypothetical protein
VGGGVAGGGVGGGGCEVVVEVGEEVVLVVELVLLVEVVLVVCRGCDHACLARGDFGKGNMRLFGVRAGQ